MLDTAIRQQLQSYLSKIVSPILLRANIDDTVASQEMLSLLKEVASLSSKVSLSIENSPSQRAPSFQITRNDNDLGIYFAGLPMGHEFTSFVLALLQAGGHPPKIDEETQQQIRALQGTFNFEIYISLSCHNCPDVVQALNSMAALNTNIRVTTIDGALFQEEVASRKVMAVPTVFLNEHLLTSGRQELRQILEKLGTDSSAKHVKKINEKPPFDVLVCGAGPAGVTAAIYAARKGLRTGIVAERLGGQVNDTNDIENFTSILKTEGPKLGTSFIDHLRAYDIDVMDLQSAVNVHQESVNWSVMLKSGAKIKTKALVVATGARWRTLNIPGEDLYRGHGVAYCPHCDGPLFKGKTVAVIGGGNSGVEAAIDLAGIVKHVTLIQRNIALTADDVLERKLRSLANVTIITNALTEELLGDGQTLQALVYRDRTSGERETINIDGCFVQIGLIPNTDWIKGAVELNQYGEIVTSTRGATSAPGIFAAGDCTDVPYKQIVIALGEGAKTSLGVFDYLMRQSAPNS